jgi:hypothetical protein
MKIEEIAISKGFTVTEKGVLLNKKGKMVGYKSNRGYMVHSIRIDKKYKQFSIHRLQAFQKYGNEMFEKGIEVRHKNGNETDNSFENILIGTHSQNIMDIPVDVRLRSAMTATSFVRKYERKEVKEFYSQNKSYTKTMAKFNISSKGTLHFILNG